LRGYEFSRVDTVEEAQFSEKLSANQAQDIYRHPLAQGPLSTSFSKSFDVYALRLLIYEIAVWKSLGEVVKRIGVTKCTPKSMQEACEKLIDGPPFQDLRFRVGDRYTNVVKTCLGGTLEDTNLGPSEPLDIYLEKVVRGLEKNKA